jgi:8-oxo-dGTP diphosphatase
MYLFTSDTFSGNIGHCDEGELKWVDKYKVAELALWEGDRIFLRLLLEGSPFFSLKLVYRSEKLLSAVLNGKELELR